MAQVIAAAIGDRERPMPRDVVVPIDGYRLRLRRRDSARIVERTRARRGTHNERRPYIAGLVVDHFRREYRRAAAWPRYRRLASTRSTDVDRRARAMLAALAEPAPAEWEEELTDRLRRQPEVRAALERMWPVLSGAELVHDLFGFEALIRSASKDVLTPDEQRLLFRERVPDVARSRSGPTPTCR